MITVSTKLIPLLGKPLGQSFSPRMQNSVYARLGIDAHYFPIEVENDHLGDVVNALRYLNCPGFAVTKPNKVEVLKYLDELDELAKKMGAVNTVVNVNGKLKGYNTDGEGCVSSIIKETNCNLKESVFFCAGAGGAARAVSSTLAYRGAKRIYIYSRYDEDSQSLANDINNNFAPIAEIVAFDDKDSMYKAIKDSHIIMNHTGIGMAPHIGISPIPKDAFVKGQFAYDAIYNPQKTKFLEDAEEMGCKIINGLGMVLGQGALQVKLWLSHDNVYDMMENALTEILADNAKENK